MGYHARLSPSGAKRWSACTASPAEELGKPNESNDASRWGTACHLLSSTCLERGDDPYMYAGSRVIFWTHDESESSGESLIAADEEPDPVLAWRYEVPIDDEQIECATVYVNFVRELRHSLNAVLHIEQPLPIDHITGETDATGTGDAVLLPKQLDELVIVDLKGGMYRVDAFEQVTEMSVDFVVQTVNRPNLQLAMYASGALRKFFDARIKRVRLIIVQPRLHHISEFSMTVEDLGDVVKMLRERVYLVENKPTYSPSFETCHYCKGKPSCNEFQNIVLDTVFDDATLEKPRDVPAHELGTLYRKLDMIELWCSSIRSLVHKQLTEWQPVTGLKIVAGRNGNRKWVDAERAQTVLTRDLGLPKTLTHVEKFVGPAKIESLTKGKNARLNDFQWSLVQGMITQEPGKPVVVFEEDPRPALASPEAAFTEITST